VFGGGNHQGADGELKGRDVLTLAALAQLPLPLAWKPERGVAASYERIREQGANPDAGEGPGKPLYETLPVSKDLGLSGLPAPSPGMCFFDLEGDPFIDEGGLEYLFGYAFEDDGIKYRAIGRCRGRGKAGVRDLRRFVMERRRRYPDFHIYHYAPYEPSAMKRLMGSLCHAGGGNRSVAAGPSVRDLYQIVRHAIRASVESYRSRSSSGFGFERTTKLEDASRALANIQTCLELKDAAAITSELKATVAGYNRDDCVSLRVCGIGWRRSAILWWPRGGHRAAGAGGGGIQREAKRVAGES